MDSKRCSACGLEKPVTEFSPSQDRKSGYKSHCKPCRRAREYTPPTIYKHGPKSVLPRFWNYANRAGDDDCWPWSGEIDMGGYGVMHLPGRKRQKAHRFSWELHQGPIPDGLFALHTCDVRNCVNPRHLFLGTHTDNMRDMVQKDRGGIGVTLKKHPELHARGDRIALAVLGDAGALEVLQRAEKGELPRSIALDLGCKPKNVYDVLNGKTYRHVRTTLQRSKEGQQ